MDLFAKRNPEKGLRTQQIKARVAELLELDQDVTVMVTELNCQDDDCPEVETVIAIFRPSSRSSRSRCIPALKSLRMPRSSDLAGRYRTNRIILKRPQSLRNRTTYTHKEIVHGDRNSK